MRIKGDLFWYVLLDTIIYRKKFMEEKVEKGDIGQKRKGQLKR